MAKLISALTLVVSSFGEAVTTLLRSTSQSLLVVSGGADGSQPLEGSSFAVVSSIAPAAATAAIAAATSAGRAYNVSRLGRRWRVETPDPSPENLATRYGSSFVSFESLGEIAGYVMDGAETATAPILIVDQGAGKLYVADLGEIDPGLLTVLGSVETDPSEAPSIFE